MNSNTFSLSETQSECGFLSNPEEASLLKEGEYQKKIAEVVCEGITRYYDNLNKNEKTE